MLARDEQATANRDELDGKKESLKRPTTQAGGDLMNDDKLRERLGVPRPATYRRDLARLAGRRIRPSKISATAATPIITEQANL